jgi:hypothetical protein
VEIWILISDQLCDETKALRKLMKKFIFILMLIFQSGIVESADFNVFGNSLYVTGHIDDGDYHKFKKLPKPIRLII